MKKKSKQILGVDFPEHWHDLVCLLYLFQHAPKLAANPMWRPEGAIPAERPYTGTGRFQHAKQISTMIYGKGFEWHDWSEQVVSAACDSNLLMISGPGASGKSTSIGLYASLFWQCAPLDSAVIVASKTIESSKKRIWREISRMYALFSSALGGYKSAAIGSSPRPSITPIDPKRNKKDESHGIYVTALHGKELDKEIGYIKGFHPRRVLVVADELDSLEEGGQALIDAFLTNLQTGAVEAQFIGLGNDPSLFNALGDWMQPELGKAVTLANTEWTSAKGARCLRLDAWDSPNISSPDKWTGLVGQKDIDNIVRHYGENSPYVWIQLHGLHPPEGAENTVMSEAVLYRFHAFDKVMWKTSFIPSASLDSGFGGDPCVFRTFRRGEDQNNILRVACDEVIEIPVDAGNTSTPAEYQIAYKVRELCTARSIPPEEFAIGSTGIGRGAAAVLQREWSPRIVCVEEGGAASDYIDSREDPRPAKEKYDRKVTELAFNTRTFVESDTLRNLDQKTAHQMCNRRYEMKGNRYCLEKKEDMKVRGLSSPNEWDALMFALHALKLKGIIAKPDAPAFKSSAKQVAKVAKEWDWDAQEELAYSSED